MDITCDNCAYPFTSPDEDADRTEWKCPICGSPAHPADPDVEPAMEPGKPPGLGAQDANLTDEIEIVTEDRPGQGSSPAPQADGSNPADTVFQPALMMNTIMTVPKIAGKTPPSVFDSRG